MRMRAMVLQASAPAETSPLQASERAIPEPAGGEILVRIHTCGVCRTDLHIVEGDLPLHAAPVVPGHQIIGTVERLGPGAGRWRLGARVGIAWLREVCGHCRHCRSGAENLCERARFTGYDRDGGYAEYACVDEDFAYAIPDGIDDAQAAPLLCAGIIGFRALKRAGIERERALGLYGFGSSAHIAIQIARSMGARVFVMTRSERHRRLAEQLGAAWTGDAREAPPEPLDSAVLFAPVGDLVPPALAALDRGGTLALAGIHLSEVPALDYQRHLFYERTLCSVTASTREDARELLRLAAEIPIRTRAVCFDLERANQALVELKQGGVDGSAVLVCSAGATSASG